MRWRETVVVDDLKLTLRVCHYFLWWMVFEAEANLQEGADQGRVDGKMQQMTLRCNHSRQFREPVVQWHVLQRPAGKNEVKRVVGERQRQQVALCITHIALTAATVHNRFSGSYHSGGRQNAGR